MTASFLNLLSGSGKLNNLKKSLQLSLSLIILHCNLIKVQKFPAYFDQIKFYYDTFRPRLRLVLSGSAALEIGSQAAETFAGRLQLIRLFPFSAKEAIHHYFPEIQLPSVLVQLVDEKFNEKALQELQVTLLRSKI